MHITAIRHLRTAWNQHGLLQGETNIPLDFDDAKNKDLVKKLQGTLADEAFDAILVSPLLRAVQTAEWLGLTSWKSEPLIAEMSFGKWEGMPKQEMLDAFGSVWVDDPLSSPLQTELELLEARLRKFLAQQKSDSKLLIISHGACIRALKSILETDSLKNMNRIYLDNGEMHTFSK
jgi:broad specificity phosphatase PhoE